jgi:hypothetical protein
MLTDLKLGDTSSSPVSGKTKHSSSRERHPLAPDCTGIMTLSLTYESDTERQTKLPFDQSGNLGPLR